MYMYIPLITPRRHWNEKLDCILSTKHPFLHMGNIWYSSYWWCVLRLDSLIYFIYFIPLSRRAQKNHYFIRRRLALQWINPRLSGNCCQTFPCPTVEIWNKLPSTKLFALVKCTDKVQVGRMYTRYHGFPCDVDITFDLSAHLST